MSEIKKIVLENRWVTYEEITSTSRRYQNFELCFADAAGEDDLENESYGIGGLSLSANFAFQIPNTIVTPFLHSIQDRNPFPETICNAEHLMQIFLLWFAFKNGLFKPGSLIEQRTDNTTVYFNWKKGRCRYSAKSNMLDLVNQLAELHGCHFEVT